MIMLARFALSILVLAPAGACAGFATASDLPLRFEPNLGQTDARVEFVARAPGQHILITREGATLVLHGRPEAISVHFRADDVRPVEFAGLEQAAGQSHYLGGSDPKSWMRGVPTFARVRAAGVMPGIDVVYYGNRGRLEYDFVVAPGADPSSIGMQFDGVERLTLTPAGDLRLDDRDDSVLQEAPIAYQMIAGQRTRVAAAYRIAGPREVRLKLGEYDPSAELVIDPVINFSTFLGGTGLEQGWAVATDSAGNVYVAGSTESLDFPVTPGAAQERYRSDALPGDAFITKLAPDGKSVIYSTFIGGSNLDEARSIAVNGQGEAFIAGETESSNFPTTVGGYQMFNRSIGLYPDAFVVKLSSDGSSLVYSTYLGDSFIDRIYGIALDSGGNAVVGGASDSDRFPTTAGSIRMSCPGTSFGGFVTKLAGNGGSLIWSTRLCGSAADEVLAVTLDSDDNVLVGGITASADFPVTTGAFQPAGADGQEDGFAAKISPDGKALIYSSFLGGSAPDAVNGIAVDGAGNAIAVGRTLSPDFPVTGGALSAGHFDQGAFDDAFVTAINAGGTSLVYSTYLGGSGSDQAVAVAADTDGGVYVTGSTTATDFPLTRGPCQNGHNGKSDAFAVKLAAGSGALEYSMLLGGRDDDAGHGIAVGPGGSAVIAGQTRSANFTTTNDSYRPAYASGYSGASDAFIARIDPGPPPSAPCIALNGLLNGASFLPGPVAPGQIVTFFGAGLGPQVPVSFDLNGGDRIAAELAGTRVLFNGVPGPVIVTSSGQVNAIVPYAVAGLESVRVSIDYLGSAAAAFSLPVASAAPALFTQNASGRGAGAILNQNSSLNAPMNPSDKGTIVQIFATGEGQTNPPGIDGKLATGGLPAPQLPVRVTIGGINAPVKYAGAAPGLVAGLIQINAEILLHMTTGSAVPVTIQIGEHVSPPGVTLSIR